MSVRTSRAMIRFGGARFRIAVWLLAVSLMWIPSAEAADDIFDIIARLEKVTSFTQAQVEEVLGVKLVPTDDEFPDDRTGIGPVLRDGVAITEIDLRRRKQKDGRYRAFLLLKIGGTCQDIVVVKAHLGQNTKYVPRHRLLSRAQAFSKRHWGDLWWGVPDGGCLDTVSFDPTWPP